MERRTFLSILTGAAGAATAAVVGIPLLGQLLAPLRRGTRTEPAAWLGLGPLESFPVGKPTRVSVPITVTDGWQTVTEQRAAWVVRRSEAEAGADGSAVVVFTASCPHLGCSVKWREPTSKFECPCHDSGFSPDGERLAGPARRGLDSLPSRVEGGSLEIQWQDFAANIKDKRPLGGA